MEREKEKEREGEREREREREREKPRLKDAKYAGFFFFQCLPSGQISFEIEFLLLVFLFFHECTIL